MARHFSMVLRFQKFSLQNPVTLSILVVCLDCERFNLLYTLPHPHYTFTTHSNSRELQSVHRQTWAWSWQHMMGWLFWIFLPCVVHDKWQAPHSELRCFTCSGSSKICKHVPSLLISVDPKLAGDYSFTFGSRNVQLETQWHPMLCFYIPFKKYTALTWGLGLHPFSPSNIPLLGKHSDSATLSKRR